jgi:HSP20 family protein
MISEETEEERRSRRTGRFDYRVTLPGEVDAQNCTADLDNGVVRLRLPKTAASARRRVPVQRGRTAVEGAPTERPEQPGG